MASVSEMGMAQKPCTSVTLALPTHLSEGTYILPSLQRTTRLKDWWVLVCLARHGLPVLWIVEANIVLWIVRVGLSVLTVPCGRCQRNACALV